MARDDTRAARLLRVLSVEESSALLRACADSCERGVVGLLVEGGLRPREVCALRAGDLRGDTVRTRGKDGRDRTVALGPWLSDALWSCLRARGVDPAPGDLLLLAADGRPLDVQAVGELVRTAARRAGLSERLSAHMLRASTLARQHLKVKHNRAWDRE
jgi:integrase